MKIVTPPLQVTAFLPFTSHQSRHHHMPQRAVRKKKSLFLYNRGLSHFFCLSNPELKVQPVPPGALSRTANIFCASDGLRQTDSTGQSHAGLLHLYHAAVYLGAFLLWFTKSLQVLLNYNFFTTNFIEIKVSNYIFRSQCLHKH